MADKTIFSDCLNNINTVVKTHKPLVYLSLKQKKRVTISDYSLVARSENLSNQLVKELKQFEFINNDYKS